MEFLGSIRIKKPATLQKWIDKGWYQREVDAGYTFAPACGRFRRDKCECAKCQKPNGGWQRKAVLERNKTDLAGSRNIKYNNTMKEKLNLMGVLDQLHLTAIKAKEIRDASASVLDTMHGVSGKANPDAEVKTEEPLGLIDAMTHTSRQINIYLEHIAQNVIQIKSLIG